MRLTSLDLVSGSSRGACLGREDHLDFGHVESSGHLEVGVGVETSLDGTGDGERGTDGDDSREIKTREADGEEFLGAGVDGAGGTSIDVEGGGGIGSQRGVESEVAAEVLDSTLGS